MMGNLDREIGLEIRRNGVTHSLTHQSIAFSASYILYVAGNCTFLDTCSKDGQATGAAPASCCSLNQESSLRTLFPKSEGQASWHQGSIATIQSWSHA